MATYKKKSVKSKSSLKDKNIESTKQVFDTLDDSASKTETFVKFGFFNKQLTNSRPVAPVAPKTKACNFCIVQK